MLGNPLGNLKGLQRVQQSHRIPVVLSISEVRTILDNISGISQLIAQLIYGAGLRVNDCLGLRVKDIDFGNKSLNVRDGKGGKDRTTLQPKQLVRPLQRYLVNVAKLHRTDLSKGAGYAAMPGAIYKKFPSASRSLAWQYAFPSSVLRDWNQSQRKVRWHM